MATHSGLQRQDIVYGSASQDVTPDGSDVTLETKVRYVVVTTAGTIKVIALKSGDGDVITFVDVPAGFVPPFRVRKIIAAGTTASVATIV